MAGSSRLLTSCPLTARSVCPYPSWRRRGRPSISNRSWPGPSASLPRWPTTPTFRVPRSSPARVFELVLTLGTGVGTAFFLDGHLLPHFEFSHTPFRKGGTYNEQLGETARRTVGTKKWQRRVLDAVETFRALTFFDQCYIGGGNSQRITGDLPADVTLVDNSAGILGGIKLWERVG